MPTAFPRPTAYLYTIFGCYLMFRNYCSNHRKTVLILLILICLFFRLSTLEILDLVDTTESRYASVATDMLHNGNFITPTIPKGAGHIPYLGKPPLHFWFMVEAYELFGVDEWTSRLPSFVSLLVILSSFVILGKNIGDDKLALRACLILCSSLLMFALSGTALLDVTLTAFVSLCVITAFLFLNGYGTLYLYSFWCSLALGVLVKGPAAIVFSGLPILSYFIFKKEFKSIFRLISLPGIIMFLAITAPWFYFSEKANPGFLKYFFLNENILRYVTKDYGDMYGQGHVEPYGTALWMFALGIFPWTSLLIGYLIKDEDKIGFTRLTFSPLGTLAFFWMIVPLSFLVFIRQLHFGYIVPALPGAALWLSEMYSYTKKNEKHFYILNKILLTIIFLCPFAAIGFGAKQLSIMYTLLALMTCFFVYKLKLGSIETLACKASLLYLLIYIEWSPIVGALRSTETAMYCISSVSSEEMPNVAVVGDRSFSAHWLSDAWREELGGPIQLSFIPDRITVPENIDFIIQSKKEPLLSDPNLNRNAEIANWRIYSRLGIPNINCESSQLKESKCCRYNWEGGSFFHKIKIAVNEIIRQGFILAKF